MMQTLLFQPSHAAKDIYLYRLQKLHSCFPFTVTSFLLSTHAHATIKFLKFDEIRSYRRSLADKQSEKTAPPKSHFAQAVSRVEKDPIGRRKLCYAREDGFECFRDAEVSVYSQNITPLNTEETGEAKVPRRPDGDVQK
uniref:Pentatricopeptide repeat-containing protein n=1 Tax=Steinernema glaseri TaxID=37863 RepID=A0A1I7ZQ40_9BILA